MSSIDSISSAICVEWRHRCLHPTRCACSADLTVLQLVCLNFSTLTTCQRQQVSCKTRCRDWIVGHGL